MSKIKINSLLKTNEEVINKEFLGIYQNDKIIYKEDSINVNILISDNKIELIRKSPDYEMNLEFIENQITKGIFTLSNYNLEMVLDVKTSILKLENNKIIIEYELKSNKEDIGLFNLELKYEVVE